MFNDWKQKVDRARDWGLPSIYRDLGLTTDHHHHHHLKYLSEFRPVQASLSVLVVGI